MAQVRFTSKAAEARWVERELKERRGNCYVAAEALYHILGGKAAGYTPMVLTMPDGERHWYLRKIFYTPLDVATTYIDPSALQFDGNPPDYTKGRGTGFLTKQPSKRARSLMNLMTWQTSR